MFYIFSYDCLCPHVLNRLVELFVPAHVLHLFVLLFVSACFKSSRRIVCASACFTSFHKTVCTACFKSSPRIVCACACFTSFRRTVCARMFYSSWNTCPILRRRSLLRSRARGYSLRQSPSCTGNRGPGDRYKTSPVL